MFGFYRYSISLSAKTTDFIGLSRCWQNAVIFLTNPDNLCKKAQSQDSYLQKTLLVFEKIFFLAIVNWMQYCTKFNLPNLMLCFVLLPFHCSPCFNFQTLYLLFCCKRYKQFSFVQCSFLSALLFWHSIFINGTVYIHWRQCILC